MSTIYWIVEVKHNPLWICEKITPWVILLVLFSYYAAHKHKHKISAYSAHARTLGCVRKAEQSKRGRWPLVASVNSVLICLWFWFGVDADEDADEERDWLLSALRSNLRFCCCALVLGVSSGWNSAKSVRSGVGSKKEHDLGTRTTIKKKKNSGRRLDILISDL